MRLAHAFLQQCLAELPYDLAAVNIDMLWHERDARSPAHVWLRKHFQAMDLTTSEAHKA